MKLLSKTKIREYESNDGTIWRITTTHTPEGTVPKFECSIDNGETFTEKPLDSLFAHNVRMGHIKLPEDFS